jgi:hypothetical protein
MPNQVTYILVANASALLMGYLIKAPELQADTERKAQIQQETQQAAYDRTEAIARSKRCMVLTPELPITDNSAAYYSSIKNGRIVIHKRRPLPNGTTVCDTNGNTGVIAMASDGTPFISDIRQLPSEQMREILQQRGVLPSTSPRPLKVQFQP